MKGGRVMTGKELAVYILTNNLENLSVKYIFSTLFMSADEAAAKFKVGSSTISAWYSLMLIDGFELNGGLYLLRDSADPRLKAGNHEVPK